MKKPIFLKREIRISVDLYGSLIYTHLCPIFCKSYIQLIHHPFTQHLRNPLRRDHRKAVNVVTFKSNDTHSYNPSLTSANSWIIRKHTFCNSCERTGDGREISQPDESHVAKAPQLMFAQQRKIQNSPGQTLLKKNKGGGLTFSELKISTILPSFTNNNSRSIKIDIRSMEEN